MPFGSTNYSQNNFFLEINISRQLKLLSVAFFNESISLTASNNLSFKFLFKKILE